MRKILESPFPHAEDEAGHAHVVPLRVYFIVYCALMVLMISTVLAARIDMPPPLNNVVALTIAVIKAVLVVLFFMQVKYGTKLTWLWAGLGFIWLFILFATVSDYYTRQWLPIQGWTP